MSIDHGKVLALADRVQRESQIPSKTSQPARLRVIADELRALAQPAEAVEGVIEIMRGVVADMALSVPRQSKTVNQELVFAWHERLSNAYQELRRLTTTAGGDNVHDATQGAVVDVPRWDFEQHADGHSLKLYPMRVADGRWVKWSDIQNRAFFEALVRSKEGTHPQAAPAPEVEKKCSYPNCNCPFDAPSDPNWCARGLKRHEVKDDA